jgi:hypothetical protein
MSKINSSVLKRHLDKQKPTSSHMAYLDKILWDIDPVYRDKFLEIRNSIELTLLDNPESENKVVSYLSWVSEKLNLINRKRWVLIKKEMTWIYA